MSVKKGKPLFVIQDLDTSRLASITLARKPDPGCQATDDKYVWLPDGKTGEPSPWQDLGMKRLVGLQGESGYCGRFFMAYLDDCHEPTLFLLTADELGDAYEDFVLYASEHLGIRIEDSELADYGVKPGKWSEESGVEATKFYEEKWKDYKGDWDYDGNPVDVESVRICELSPVSIEFLP